MASLGGNGFIRAVIISILIATLCASLVQSQNYQQLLRKAVSKYQTWDKWQLDLDGPLMAALLGLPEEMETLQLDDLESRPDIKNLTKTACFNATRDLIEDTVKLKLYALKAFDAWGKPPPGILQGDVNWWGSYDECISNTYMENDTLVFQGTYSYATLTIPQLASVQVGANLGMCLPDQCTEEDMEAIITTVMWYAEQLVPQIKNFTLIDVTFAGPRDYTAGDYVAIVIFTMLAFMVSVGTLFEILFLYTPLFGNVKEKTKTVKRSAKDDKGILVDNDEVQHQHDEEGGTATFDVSRDKTAASKEGVYSVNASKEENHSHSQEDRGRQQAMWERILLSFSVITNASKLLSTPKSDGQTLGVINGLRLFSMWWVILGHTYIFSMTVLSNPIQLLNNFKRFTLQVIANGFFSVDTFFFLSGFLVAYVNIGELYRRKGKINWPFFYFHRFWRLTPAYMLVLLFWMTLFLHLLRGPMMRALDVNFFETTCDKYWWANLLYINNFYPDSGSLQSECMGWTWYLANDMQFYIISPVLIYLLYRNWKIGVGVCVSLIVFFTALTGGISRHNHIQPSLVTGIATGDFKQSDFDNVDLLYDRPYYRITPYIIGILGGYILTVKRDGIHIHKAIVLTLWALSIGLGIAVVYGLYPTWHGTVLSPDVNAFYNCMSRNAWALALLWVTLACIWGYGGPINTFLSWGVWAPLGRLTYCAYLIHPIVIYFNYYSRRVPLYTNDITMIYMYIGNLVIAYMVAFVLSLSIESPLMALEKIALQRKKETKAK